jgi:DNA-binding winged helix-turn-helix (wHTH) protein
VHAFGAFRIDLHAGQLLREGSPVDLEPTVFALLVYFLRNPQRLIGRDELLDELWKDAHVGDASLSRAVARLREALEDDAHDPQYIETVPRRGYRFIVPVREDAPAARYSLSHGLREFILTPGAHVIGRAPDSAVRIESTEVSRRHAQVTIGANGATISDLGSKNGTIIAGRRLTHSLELRDGDEIRLGTIVLIFHASSGSAQTDTTPPRDGFRPS